MNASAAPTESEADEGPYTETARAFDDLAPGAIERPFEAIHHLFLRPEILRQILHPFEIADDDAAGVAKDVGDDENLVVAFGERAVGLRRRRPVGAFGEDAALQSAGDLFVDHPLDRAGGEHIAALGQ